MIDLLALAAQAISASLPSIKKGAEKATDAVGKDIWKLVKGKLTSPAQKEAVHKLEAEPKKVKKQAVVKSELKNVLEKDQDFMEELQKLVAKVTAPSIRKTNKMKIEAKHSIGIQDNQGSISITKG